MAGSVYNIKNARTGNIEYTHIYAYQVPLGVSSYDYICLYLQICVIRTPSE